MYTNETKSIYMEKIRKNGDYTQKKEDYPTISAYEVVFFELNMFLF